MCLRDCVSYYTVRNILISDDTQDRHIEVKSQQQVFVAMYMAETAMNKKFMILLVLYFSNIIINYPGICLHVC